jgi:hypothetical protein
LGVQDADYGCAGIDLMRDKQPLPYHDRVGRVSFLLWTQNQHLLTPEGPKAIFMPFLKFGQDIVKSILLKKLMHFLISMWISTSFKAH